MNSLTNILIVITSVFLALSSVHASLIPTAEHQEGGASAAGAPAILPFPPPQTAPPTPLFIPNPNVPSKADVCLVVDVTGSFHDDLPNLKAQTDSIINIPGLDDARFGLVGFRDYPVSTPVPCLHCRPHIATTTTSTDGVASLSKAGPEKVATDFVPLPRPVPPPPEVDFPYRLYTPLTTGAKFKAAVLRLRAAGGGDFKEAQLDAIVRASAPGAGGCGWRPGRSRILIAATDAGCKLPSDGQNYRNDIRSTVDALQARGIVFIGLVTGPQARVCFKQIADATGGLVLELKPDSSNFKRVTTDALAFAASAPIIDSV